MTRCKGSAPSCAAATNDSPTASAPGLTTALAADECYVEVEVAWRCAQLLRDAYTAASLTDGRAIAEKGLITNEGVVVA